MHIGFRELAFTTPIAHCPSPGVVRSVRLAGPEHQARSQLFVPYGPRASQGTTYVAVKAARDPRALVTPIRSAAAAIDPNLPLYSVRTFDDIRRAYLAGRRFAMTMMSAFGGLAFVLAAVGLYGVIAYVVQLRTREIGIRMALGASASAVRWQIIRSGLLLSLSGIAIGCVAASAGGRILRASIPGLAGVDPVEMAILAVGLVAVSVCATWLPAARATRVDPLITLRAE